MVMFIQLEKGAPKQWPIAPTDVWRYASDNISFPGDCTDADLSAFGFEKLYGDPPDVGEDRRTVETAPTYDGRWNRNWDTVEVRRLIDKAIILDRITDEQLTRALSIMTQRQKERWRMPSKPRIYVDDPDLLSLLQAVGADPAVILAA